MTIDNKTNQSHTAKIIAPLYDLYKYIYYKHIDRKINKLANKLLSENIYLQKENR